MKVYVYILQPNWTIPAKPKTVYSINCGNSEMWDDPTRAFVDWATKQPSPYSLRYIGSMVADVHRSVLCKSFLK